MDELHHESKQYLLMKNVFQVQVLLYDNYLNFLSANLELSLKNKSSDYYYFFKRALSKKRKKSSFKIETVVKPQF